MPTKNCSFFLYYNINKKNLQNIVVRLFLKHFNAVFFKIKLKLQLFMKKCVRKQLT